MSIPLAIFYYLYLIFVLIFLLFTLFNIYLLIRFSYLTLVNLVIIGFYIAVSILILLISWGYISTIDWHQSIQLIPTSIF